MIWKVVKKIFIPLTLYRNWWVVYFDHLRKYPKKTLKLDLVNGNKFYIRSQQSEGLIINGIWGEKSYNPPGFEIEKNNIIVDIGAHKGIFSIFASYQAPEGKIFSFEPYPENFHFLERNIRLNKVKNVTPYMLAISGEKGSIKLYVSSEYSAGISVIKSSYLQGKSIKPLRVKSITLSDVFNHCKIKKIDYLKIDCEGAEYDILLKTSKSTLRKISKIGMEYHQIQNLKVESITQHLKRSGFEVRISPIDSVIGMLYATKK